MRVGAAMSQRSDYGVRWRFALIGLVAWGGWLAMQSAVAIAAMRSSVPLPAPLTIAHGVGLVWLSIALFLSTRLMSVRLADVLEQGAKRTWTAGLVAVLAIYAGHYAYCLAFGVPQEPFMARLFVGMTTLQVMTFLATVLTIVPVAEELAFRHFLLGALPHRSRRLWAVLGTFATAAVFAALHGAQYQYTSTLVQLFLLGCAFAIARIRTGGLVLPVAMHVEAVVLGLLLNALR